MRKLIVAETGVKVFIDDSPQKHKEIFYKLVDAFKEHGEFHSSMVFAHGDYCKHFTKLCASVVNKIFEIEFEGEPNLLDYDEEEEEV